MDAPTGEYVLVRWECEVLQARLYALGESQGEGGYIVDDRWFDASNWPEAWEWAPLAELVNDPSLHEWGTWTVTP